MDGGELRRAGGAGPGRRRQGIRWSRSQPRTGGAALDGASPCAGGGGFRRVGRRRSWPSAARVQAAAGEGTGWSEGAARNPPATSGCAAQRPVLPPRQHKGEREHHGRPRLPPRQRWTGSSMMASMADGEIRHDLLPLDTLRRHTNKIHRENRRGHCPRRRSTWVISPGAR